MHLLSKKKPEVELTLRNKEKLQRNLPDSKVCFDNLHNSRKRQAIKSPALALYFQWNGFRPSGLKKMVKPEIQGLVPYLCASETQCFTCIRIMQVSGALLRDGNVGIFLGLYLVSKWTHSNFVGVTALFVLNKRITYSMRAWGFSIPQHPATSPDLSKTLVLKIFHREQSEKAEPYKKWGPKSAVIAPNFFLENTQPHKGNDWKPSLLSQALCSLF